MTTQPTHTTTATVLVAKRRLTGKEGRERIREVQALLGELPEYRNGPYADLRKWLMSEIEDTRVRASAVHRDSIAVFNHPSGQNSPVLWALVHGSYTTTSARASARPECGAIRLDGDTAGYHFYPPPERVSAWLDAEGLDVVAEGYDQEDGWGYRHLLLRSRR